MSNWGFLAQFTKPSDLMDAVRRLREADFIAIETFTPFPIDELNELLPVRRSPMPLVILVGGLIGGASIYLLQYWVNVSAYPINIGGRPLHSWPAFIPPTFECIVLLASLFAFVGVILVCGLPRLHHPLFEIEAFKRASTDVFFVAVRTDDARYDARELRELLTEAGASQTWEVPNV
ncbi:DUF3341 domain-containing protein [Novipirellula rosea]|uniref:DUF3341 domain-containing protein n=1 Tax=Novipirellula rosea TaxID=1031540 RepID=A0ABP8NLW2_9BACT